MNLLVETGNTALKAAWAEGTTLSKTYRYQGEKTLSYLLNLIGKEKPEVLTIASTVGVTAEEEKILKTKCNHLLILDKSHTDLLLKYNLPEYLSYDRAAEIIASSFLFSGKPCTIVDFGTTLTIDFISATGRYLGGNISLGCRTRFKALNRYSKSLPLVDTPKNILSEGNSINSSMESGVISGIMFEIEGYLRLRPDNIVIFTGGDAIYFAKKMKNSIFVVCNLVMKGLALITEDYVAKNIK